MQLYYLITKSDTESIRFGKTEIQMFSQNVAKGFDTWEEVKKALSEEVEKRTSNPERYTTLWIHRDDSGRVKSASFKEPEFHEDYFGHKYRSVEEIFIVKAVV